MALQLDFLLLSIRPLASLARSNSLVRAGWTLGAKGSCCIALGNGRCLEGCCLERANGCGVLGC